MYNPEIIHTLTAVNPYTPRAVHDVFGIDYNKPFFASCISGPATIGKIEKTITAGGIDPRDACNIVLIRDRGPSYRSAEYHAVTLDGKGNFDIEHRDNYWRSGTNRPRAGFDWFCRKSDFHEYRKSQTSEIIIISQHAEHLHKPAEKTMDPGERYKVLDIGYCLNSTENYRYISRLTVQRTTDNGSKKEIQTKPGRVIYRGQWEPQTLSEIIDGSGYFVHDRREDLKRRARVLKAQREKDAANAADYTAQINELNRLFQARKRTIAAALDAAHTSTAIKAVSYMIDDYKTGLKWAAYDLEKFIEAAENKKFTSPARARAAYDSIRAKLEPETVYGYIVADHTGNSYIIDFCMEEPNK